MNSSSSSFPCDDYADALTTDDRLYVGDTGVNIYRCSSDYSGFDKVILVQVPFRPRDLSCDDQKKVYEQATGDLNSLIRIKVTNLFAEFEGSSKCSALLPGFDHKSMNTLAYFATVVSEEEEDDATQKTMDQLGAALLDYEDTIEPRIGRSLTLEEKGICNTFRSSVNRSAIKSLPSSDASNIGEFIGHCFSATFKDIGSSSSVRDYLETGGTLSDSMIVSYIYAHLQCFFILGLSPGENVESAMVVKTPDSMVQYDLGRSTGIRFDPTREDASRIVFVPVFMRGVPIDGENMKTTVAWTPDRSNMVIPELSSMDPEGSMRGILEPLYKNDGKSILFLDLYRALITYARTRETEYQKGLLILNNTMTQDIFSRLDDDGSPLIQTRLSQAAKRAGLQVTKRALGVKREIEKKRRPLIYRKKESTLRSPTPQQMITERNSDQMKALKMNPIKKKVVEEEYKQIMQKSLWEDHFRNPAYALYVEALKELTLRDLFGWEFPDLKIMNRRVSIPREKAKAYDKTKIEKAIDSNSIEFLVPDSGTIQRYQTERLAPRELIDKKLITFKVLRAKKPPGRDFQRHRVFFDTPTPPGWMNGKTFPWIDAKLLKVKFTFRNPALSDLYRQAMRLENV